jgi:hypothetical protein
MSDTHSHGGGGGFSLSTAIAALISALVLAVAADLMTPYGPVVLTMAAVFGVLAAIAGVLSLLPPLTGLLRGVAGFALINALACALFVGLWYIAPKPAATERGVFATLAPFGDTLQGVMVTPYPKGPPQVETAAAPVLSPSEQAMQALAMGLASADPAERVRAGVNVLGNDDDAVIAAAIDKLYRSNDPALRQLAVKRLLSMRRGARMPLLAVAATEDAQPFANALQGVGFTIRSLNETSGAFDGGLCAPTGMAGTVNRTGVTISARCKIGADDRNTVLVLQPTDDFRLVGEARNDAGQSVKVELPLM